MLYSYFTDKTDILRHLCDETFEHLDEILEALAQRQLAPLEHLVEASREFARFSLENPHHFKVFLMASTDFGDIKAVDFIGERGLASFQRLRAIYEAADLMVERPHGSLIWWNALKGVIDFVNLHRAAPWFDAPRLLEVTIATLVEGHRTPPVRD
jgi:AcrR family transcriptional regulator